jgi:acylphosphatase
MAERCVRALISGTVQGVWFRNATQRSARALGARGYVRNLPDRRVEAVFQGNPDTVESALAFVREGPPDARVTQVEVEELSNQEFHDFEIRY